MSNDVILVPVTTVRPDLITQTDHIVYVPLASKTSHGIIKVGEGLNITQDGTLSFDRSEVTIKKVSLNGTEILPVEKNVNIEIDKTTVGLNNVDNTSDKDKPVSDATQEVIDELNTMLMDDILDVDDKIVYHMNDFENPHRVTKSQVGLDRVDNTSDVEKPISRATKNELIRIEGLINGASGAVSYPNYEFLIDAFNLLDRTTYPVGQSIYIETLNVPDLWIYAVEETSEPFEYTDDELIQSLLKYDGSFKVGFYRLAALETGKINLEDYVTLDTEQTISGDKNYVGELRYNGMDVATIDDINAVTLDSLSFQTTAGELIYANEKAYYQGQFTYTTKKSATPVSIDGTLVLPVKGDGVTISSDGNALLIKAVIPEVDTSNLVTLDGIQNITGTKVFNEQIGILNGAEGEINYIKHINNNFLISASDGENIINIDEQLKTFNFYNKPLALEEYVDDNFVSFTTQQMLTEEQKETVRNNIGVGTSSGSTIVVDSELSTDSENPVQNKVLYNPVSFAENERQKSKNLFNKDNIVETHYDNVTTVIGNVIYVATGENSRDAIFQLIPVQAGKTYYLKAVASNRRILFTLYDANKSKISNNLVGSGWVYNESYEGCYKDFDSEQINTSFGIPDGVHYIAFTTIQHPNLHSFENVIISEYADVDDYQPYYGAIVHEEKIADVEHIEVIYNKADPKKRTFAGRTYTAGIPPETYTQDVSKYKKLRVHMGVDYSRNVVEVDLTCPNASDTFVGTNAVSFEIYQSKFYGHSGYVEVQADKSTISMAFTRIQGTSQSSAGIIYKIEGVY